MAIEEGVHFVEVAAIDSDLRAALCDGASGKILLIAILLADRVVPSESLLGWFTDC
jgi:hypothetical protein